MFSEIGAQSAILQHTCDRASFTEESSKKPDLLKLLRSKAYSPIAVAHRGEGSCCVDITPNGIFCSVKGEPSGTIGLNPILQHWTVIYLEINSEVVANCESTFILIVEGILAVPPQSRSEGGKPSGL